MDSAYPPRSGAPARDHRARHYTGSIRGTYPKSDRHASPPREDISFEEDDTDDEELTPLQYAQRHGLTTPYSNTNLFPGIEALPSNDELLLDLDGPHCSFHLVEDEKWIVDKATAQLLVSVVDIGNVQTFDEVQSAIVRMSHYKTEEAMLAFDPQLDDLQLTLRNKVTISAAGMQPFELSDAQGESLVWSTEELHTALYANELAAKEKFEIDEGAMSRIRLVMESAGGEWNEMIDLARKLECTRNKLPKLLTPPLMPLSPPGTPSALSGPGGEIPFTSTPEDLCAAEIGELDLDLLRCENERVFDPAKSQPIFPTIDSEALSLPWVLEETNTAPISQQKMSSIQLDTPLMLADWTEYGGNEAADFLVPADLQALKWFSETDLEKDFVEFTDQVLEPSAMSVDKQIEAAQLGAINTTLRMEVPAVPSMEAIPPWKTSDARSMLSTTRDLLANQDRRWKGLSAVERALSWTPFPSHLGRVPSEGIFDDATFAKSTVYLPVDDDMNIENLLWKREALGVLEVSETEDDDLEQGPVDDPEVEQSKSPTVLVPASPSQRVGTIAGQPQAIAPQGEIAGHPDMRTLLRKRKLELEKSAGTEPKLKRHALDANEQHSDTISRLRSGFGGFTSVNGLSAFMHLQGCSVRPHPDSTNRLKQQVAQVTQPVAVSKPDTTEHKFTNATREPVIFDESLSLQQPASIIVSSTFFKNRHLVRQIQKALPNVDLVERGTQRSEDGMHGSRCDEEEADITVSPATGLVITTLQKVKQRPLPGQKAFFGIGERIATLSVRYERLIVLISDNRGAPDNDTGIVTLLDASDTVALSDFIGFGSRLDSDVEVYYVPNGGDAVVQWIAATISRHSVRQGDVELLHDETLWERLLRCAGFNAFAAQAVLCQMKVPRGPVNGNESLGHGLTAFMRMSGGERMQRLASCLGGERVLGRVNDAIARGWGAK